MSFRFWRRIRIAPGVTLNMSKSTASLSFGPCGAKYTVSPRCNRVRAGLPGTGLFYTVHEPRRPSSANAPGVAQRDRLDLGFFQRLFTHVDERALVDGLKALNAGYDGTALAEFEKAASLPDAAWMAGMLQLRREEFAPARRHLEAAPPGTIQRAAAALEQTMREDVAAGRPMIAALVISRAGDMPRRGFLDFAVELGRFPEDPRQHRAALEVERAAVFETWADTSS